MGHPILIVSNLNFSESVNCNACNLEYVSGAYENMEIELPKLNELERKWLTFDEVVKMRFEICWLKQPKYFSLKCLKARRGSG